MKILAFVFFALITLKTFGQLKKASAFNSPATIQYFLDSVGINKNQLFFNPNKITAINVVKRNNRDLNSGEIYITSKNPKDFKFLTLADVRKTYLKSKDVSVLFMIDDKVLKDDISTYKIDADYILNVEVLKSAEISSLKNSMQNFAIISIKLKTKENLAKVNEIYIRGTDLTQMPPH